MQYSWASGDKPTAFGGGHEARPAHPLVNLTVFTDFAFFTRDKPWLKGLLELLPLVYLFVVGAFWAQECSSVPVPLPAWLVTFAVADLLQLWTYALLKAKGYLPVVYGWEALTVFKHRRHGAVFLFWLLTAFLLAWEITGIVMLATYSCPVPKVRAE